MIKIMPRREVVEFDTNIIIIDESDLTEKPEIRNIVEKAKNAFYLVFDDIREEHSKYKACTKEQIARVLEWGKDKEDITVCCHAGISRSAAIAYLLACQKDGEGLKVLDRGMHCPNRRVVKFGAEILNDERIYEKYRKWLKEGTNYVESK